MAWLMCHGMCHEEIRLKCYYMFKIDSKLLICAGCAPILAWHVCRDQLMYRIVMARVPEMRRVARDVYERLWTIPGIVKCTEVYIVYRTPDLEFLAWTHQEYGEAWWILARNQNVFYKFIVPWLINACSDNINYMRCQVLPTHHGGRGCIAGVG